MPREPRREVGQGKSGLSTSRISFPVCQGPVPPCSSLLLWHTLLSFSIKELKANSLFLGKGQGVPLQSTSGDLSSGGWKGIPQDAQMATAPTQVQTVNPTEELLPLLPLRRVYPTIKPCSLHSLNLRS